MSRRIDELLGLLDLIRAVFDPAKGKTSVREVRLEAQDILAEDYQREATTISNKFRRELEPEIKSTEGFDIAIQDWLCSGSDYLERVIQRHCVDAADEGIVREFFAGRTLPALSEYVKKYKEMAPRFSPPQAALDYIPILQAQFPGKTQEELIDLAISIVAGTKEQAKRRREKKRAGA